MITREGLPATLPRVVLNDGYRLPLQLRIQFLLHLAVETVHVDQNYHSVFLRHHLYFYSRPNYYFVTIFIKLYFIKQFIYYSSILILLCLLTILRALSLFTRHLTMTIQSAEFWQWHKRWLPIFFKIQNTNIGSYGTFKILKISKYLSYLFNTIAM